MDLPSDPEHMYLQMSHNAGYQLGSADTGLAAVSPFANANNVRIKDSTLSMTVTTHVHAEARPALEVLYKRVAPNAILNKGGRGEDAKCYPGTRKEVIGLIEQWADDADSDRIFWMSGPAGGGKTAIMKTIAERSKDRGAPTVNFFFFRGDSTRNSARPVVATLLYQLLQLYPSTLEVVAKILSERPRILDESLDEQCRLISALFPIIQKSAPTGPPIVLLVDGLDECDVEAGNSQLDILRAFERLVTQADSPFRLLVASRREAHIQMAFNELPSRTRPIFLSEEYSPEDDIRIFVEAEFKRIKASHPSKHSLPAGWPSSSDVEAIIRKSSGQFIYAATVMRHISHPSMVPALSLERVTGIAPTAGSSPFAHLDDIYTFILDRASVDPEVTHDILSVELLALASGIFTPAAVLFQYNARYKPPLMLSCISEISAIVRLNERENLEFYHASLADFLIDPVRSGIHWIDVHAFRAKVVVELWRQFLLGVAGNDLFVYFIFCDLEKPTPDVTYMLLNASMEWMRWPMRNKLLWAPLNAIEKMYYGNDIETYKSIICRATLMAVSSDMSPTESSLTIPLVEEYYLFYQKWKWWFQLLNRFCRKKQQS